MGSSRDRLPHFLHQQIRRDAEFPELVKAEEEAERLEAERREAVAASRRKRFLAADIDDDPNAASSVESQEASW